MDILAVARRAGVSTATVSRVLNQSDKVREKTAVRVREAIAELDYVPNNHARSLRSGRSNLYGLLVSDVRNPFFPDVIEHFESLATQHGIDVTFANTGYDEQRLFSGVRRLLDRGVDGIAVFSSEVSAETLQRVRSASVPVVFFNQADAIGEFPTITIDYEFGMREAIDHLQLLGHERIAFISGSPAMRSAKMRRAAFFSVMQKYNLPIREDWILEGDHQLAGGKVAAARFFTMNSPPTAVICSNDLTAIGFLHTANRLQRKVPEEVSLIGLDNLALSEIIQPSLTTLHLSRRDIATRAFYALQPGEGTGVKPSNAIIQPQLVIRESTGPCRSSGST